MTTDHAQSWFEIFNRLQGTGTRLVFAADHPPSALALRDDLRTRLGSGVVFEILPLSESETLDAMRAHAQARKMPLPDGLLTYLLGRARRDLASQIALLDALDRCALAAKRPLTLPLARTVIQQLEQQLEQQSSQT
jgi:DnaA-homolog protein